MKKCSRTGIVTLSIISLLIGSTVMASEVKFEGEKAVIKSVIEASIGWALTKDFDLLYNSLAQDYGIDSAK